MKKKGTLQRLGTVPERYLAHLGPAHSGAARSEDPGRFQRGQEEKGSACTRSGSCCQANADMNEDSSKEAEQRLGHVEADCRSGTRHSASHIHQ